MNLRVLYVTDPACPWSWGAEPALRRLCTEFADQVQITYVMGGLAREFRRPAETARHWLDAAAATGMPCDARGWLDTPMTSSYPACLAVKAAAEQRLDGPYLRRLREAIALERVKADGADALTAVARRVPGLDVARFSVDLGSNAIVEALGSDLERARGLAPEHHGEHGRVPFPSFVTTTDDGATATGGAFDSWEVEPLRRVALDAGLQAGPLPAIEEALRRFGRMATAEVAAVCDLPGPRAPAELWRLALEWRTRRDGELWVPA